MHILCLAYLRISKFTYIITGTQHFPADTGSFHELSVCLDRFSVPPRQGAFIINSFLVDKGKITLLHCTQAFISLNAYE